MRYVIDIETNGLLSDMVDYSSFPYKLRKDAKLWCVVITNVDTLESKIAKKGEITREWLEESLSDCTELIAHNGIKFDYISLKLFGLLDYKIGYIGQPDTLYGREIKFTDTLVVSRILNPTRKNGHGLGEWGLRVGEHKTDFRGVCIEKGYISAKAKKGEEFLQFCEEMVDYCVQDTVTNVKVFLELMREMGDYDYTLPLKVENKLADLAVRRENFGFYFDKELADKNLAFLTDEMEMLTNAVEPILPPKPRNKGELDKVTPPKNQIKKDGTLTKSMEDFIEKVGAECGKYEDGMYFIIVDDKEFTLPVTKPVRTHIKATIGNLDHIKEYLLKLGWKPTEWKERDLTKDSKKVSLTYEARVRALDRWADETANGKYREQRLDIIGYKSKTKFLEDYKEKLKQDFPVKVPTSPSIRIGVEKELCPNLVKLGDKVGFVKDLVLYLTYKHRKSAIAGGDLDEDGEPIKGYLSFYRSVDSRIPTPAIEIGANSHRYTHIGVANVPRAGSVFGEEMRSLFGSGKDFLQFGFDFSSLEARIQGHYCLPFDGKELAVDLLAEKPNDLHSKMGVKLGISRGDAKAVNYALIYGASAYKLMAMLGVSKERAKEIYDEFWEAVLPLKKLRETLLAHWEKNKKMFIRGIDGRKIQVRSPHSALNSLFQSAGVISAKYVTVFLMQLLEEQGQKIDVFESKPDVCGMIEYHDENQLATKKDNIKFKVFETKEEANDFINNWKGEQLGALQHGNKYYVCTPNVISLSVNKAIEKTTELLKLRVPLGFEWVVGRNWKDCH